MFIPHKNQGKYFNPKDISSYLQQAENKLEELKDLRK